jgi:Lrp/AsnC family transcriptional regulator for asnA, asnC and gidA
VGSTDIDGIDKAILIALLSDARMSFAYIGRTLSISRNNVRNRYERMKKSGLIVRSSVQINYKHLGFEFVTLLLDVNPLQLEEIRNYLQGIPNALGPCMTAGKYNGCVVLTYKNSSQIANIKHHLRQMSGVKDLKMGVCTEIFLHPENIEFFSDCKIDSGPIFKNADFLKGTLDKLDFDLVTEIANDSSASFRSIAKKLGVSADTICRRYRKLVSGGVIVSGISLNLQKVGCEGVCLFYIDYIESYSFSPLESLLERVSKLPGLFAAYIYNGDFKLELAFANKKAGDIIHEYNEILKLPGVVRTEIMVFPMCIYPPPTPFGYKSDRSSQNLKVGISNKN